MPSAIVTGAGSGIGRSIALKLASTGYAIVAAGRTHEALAQTVELITRAGGMALAVPTDVTKPEQVQKLVTATLEQFGEINAVVNTAGVAPMIGTPDISTEQWHEIMDTNLSSVFYMVRAVWPHMHRQHLEYVSEHRDAHGDKPLPRDGNSGGVIVNFSSMAARDPFPGLGAYAVAKVGVNMLTQVLAREGEPLGIRVHAVAPAGVETGMFRNLLTPDQVPGEEILQPDEVADVVLQMVNGALRFTSGEALYMHRRM